MAEIQFAAGARSVYAVHEHGRPLHQLGAGEAGHRRACRCKPLLARVVSAHVMGGCAMSDDARLGVTGADGRYHGVRNLSVHDGSLFPTSIGANPQLSIYALAARLASGLAQAADGQAGARSRVCRDDAHDRAHPQVADAAASAGRAGLGVPGHAGVGRRLAACWPCCWRCAMLLAVRALIVVRNFWQSRRLASPVPPEYQLGAVGAARLFLGELRATLWTSSWGMLRPRLHAADTITGQGLPVLLVHGYVCNSGYWTQLSRQLAQAGIVHDGDRPGTDHRRHRGVRAAGRASHRPTLCARTGSDRVIIVAHSMGGLVARAWLRHYGAARVARIITLGTPHHGTALANSGGGRQCAADEPHRWRAQRLAGAAGRQRRRLRRAP